MIDKLTLPPLVLARLADDLQHTEQAALAAHATATHEENVAENKYDTLGLEAAYLATGQARRADAMRQAIAQWRQFRPQPYQPQLGIQRGALVCLVDAHDQQQLLFLGPAGGSMKLLCGAHTVQVISGDTPLGVAMWGKGEGDEVAMQIGATRQVFEVLWVQ